jgi:tetratricopeptide (TPR) repeat protein
MRPLRSALIIFAAFHCHCAAGLAQDAPFEQARQARLAGRLDEAEPILTVIVRREPENYLGLYNLGLLYEARAVRAQEGEPRLEHYRTAAGFLERAVRSPQRQASGSHAYTIFNSIGMVYLALNDLNRAHFYLDRGLHYQAQLNDFSRGRLYGNLGYLYALEGDIPRARHYFEEGARLNSNFARENLRRFNEAGIR